MRGPVRLGLLVLSFAVAGCASADPFALFHDEPWTLVHGGTIYVDPQLPPVEAVLIHGKRVVDVGAADELRPGLPRGARNIHLRGGVAVPGLVDSHGHIANLGASLEQVDLRGATSYADVIERVQTQAAKQGPGTWIIGRGWDQSLWADRSFPHHAPLSTVLPAHPVLLTRVDGHAALANARALKLAGLLAARPVPRVDGGRVEVDADGAPTGLLIDTAIALVANHVPEPDREDLRRRILLAQEVLLELGLVAVHDMGISPTIAGLLEELEEEGQLDLRVIAYLWGNDGLDARTRARYPRAGDDDPGRRLRVIGAKLMLDGALGSRGAALLEDYADAPGERGLLRMDHEAFRARVRQVVGAGLQPATHAIGDRANRMLLDVYAEVQREQPALAELRPRVEHAQVVARDDWARFEALGVVASMQPTHATTDMRWAEARLGHERIAGAYAWRRLMQDPGTLAFGSDFPVESPDPLEGLYAARTRQDQDGQPSGGWLPDQRLSGREALAGFTTGAARAVREEERRGRLLPGYYADLTVLDVDPVTCDPADLLKARVSMTVVDGETVFIAEPER